MTRHAPKSIELRIFPRNGPRRSYTVEAQGGKVVSTFGRVGRKGRTSETDYGSTPRARSMMIRRALAKIGAGFHPIDSTGRRLRGARSDRFLERLQDLLAQIVVPRASKKVAVARSRKSAKSAKSAKSKKRQKNNASRQRTTPAPASAKSPIGPPLPFYPLPTSPPFFSNNRTSWGSVSFGAQTKVALGPHNGVYNAESMDAAPSCSLISKSYNAANTPSPKPLLLWVDDKPENNGKFLSQIVIGALVEVVQLTSTRASKTFLHERPHLREANNAHFRIITDRTRQEQGETLFEWNYRAGEELIIWLRENGWNTPAMLFCSQPEDVLQLEKQYPSVRVSRTPDEGVEFGTMRMFFALL